MLERVSLDRRPRTDLGGIDVKGPATAGPSLLELRRHFDQPRAFLYRASTASQRIVFHQAFR